MNKTNLLRRSRAILRPWAIINLIFSLVGIAGAQERNPTLDALRKGLTFHASFDRTTNADFALGDRQIFSAASMKQAQAGQPGLPATGVVTHAVGQGRFGDALRFHKKAPGMVFFRAERNVDYRTNLWSGTVSFWLRVNPEAELAPGYCDPLQITPRQWNDAAFFVEFEKKKDSIPFRLGVYADGKVWNPQNRDWNSIPASEKPLVTVEKPPFAGDRWIHAVFTFSNFNTGRPDGVAKLYLDGHLEGTIKERQQTFTWDPSKTLVMLGLSYVGWLDELAIFNRALAPKEIQTLNQLEEGVRSLIEQ